MDQDQKVLLIIAKLIDRVGAGLDQWTEDVSGFMMCMRLPSTDDEENFVVLTIQEDVPDGYEFRILNSKRVRIFSLQSKSGASHSKDLELMRRLHRTVRSKYYDVPAILDQIIADLEPE